MVRSDLARKLAKEAGIPITQAEKVTKTFFEAITDRLAASGRVELRNFGVFYGAQRRPIDGRNPKSGEAVPVPARRVPRFRASAKLQARVDKYESPQ